MIANSSKEEQSARTRQTLIDVARGLFARDGYADTGTEDIVQQAGVTRGALYHHFVDKRDLFEAVYINLQDELRDRILAAAGSPELDSIWVRLHRGTHEYLDHYMDPMIQRIVLIDAPSVLGWNRWRELDAAYALGLLQHALRTAAEQRTLAVGSDSDVLAHLMLGVISEASHVIANADDVAAARQEVGADVDRLLDSLRTAPRNEL
jgi:AcrR family transcriptional regulator